MTNMYTRNINSTTYKNPIDLLEHPKYRKEELKNFLDENIKSLSLSDDDADKSNYFEHLKQSNQIPYFIQRKVTYHRNIVIAVVNPISQKIIISTKPRLKDKVLNASLPICRTPIYYSKQTQRESYKNSLKYEAQKIFKKMTNYFPRELTFLANSPRMSYYICLDNEMDINKLQEWTVSDESIKYSIINMNNNGINNFLNERGIDIHQILTCFLHAYNDYTNNPLYNNDFPKIHIGIIPESKSNNKLFIPYKPKTYLDEKKISTSSGKRVKYNNILY